MSRSVEFFFDFSSAYSYIGHYRITQLALQHGLTVRWCPIALGILFKARGHAPPSPESDLGRYIWHDVERCAKECGLPWQWPTPFPFNSLSAARIFHYLASTAPEQAEPWARAVFRAAYAEGRDCSSPDTLLQLAHSLGLDGAVLLAAAAEPTAKQALQRATEEAATRGVFGAPTFFFEGEMYWGADRIDQLQRRLTGTHL